MGKPSRTSELVGIRRQITLSMIRIRTLITLVVLDAGFVISLPNQGLEGDDVVAEEDWNEPRIELLEEIKATKEKSGGLRKALAGEQTAVGAEDVDTGKHEKKSIKKVK